MKTVLRLLLLIVMIASFTGILFGAYHQAVIFFMSLIVYGSLPVSAKKPKGIYRRTFEAPK